MTSRTKFALVSLTTLAVAACGSSDSHVTAMGLGGATSGVSGSGATTTTPSGSAGSSMVPTTPSGAGGATGLPSGAGGSMISGSMGGVVMMPSGAGGSTTGGGGAAPSGTGGTAGACDDNALASSKDACNPSGDPCNLHSGYPGDEYCMLPPPDGKGIQIHFGPKSYTDPNEVAKYVMNAGEEFNAYGLATIPGSGDHYYNNVQIRMRPGSHHLINTLVTGTDSTPDGFVANSIGCPGTPVGSFPGSQNLIRNMPPGGVQAPENVGIGSELQGGTRLCLNHHAYNFDSDQPKLREIWINVWFVDESEVTQKTQAVTITAGPFQGIPPHTQKVLKATGSATGTGRIITMFGHRHAATDRFAVWKNDELVYDSWHWDESVTYDYDSITTNPAPNPTAKDDGATSGILPVAAGDKINIECDVNNTTDNTLTFKNELYTGEMCILFGSAVGTAIH
ncbi:MAG TPA: hypothetical protein VH062_04545 [Polyangiaceae bacterium]|jgi:hypothetical protein|nr:hypothetical protein [Polyangiaceae bacterium]